jgi:prepilin-type N-terminal cleavage/methylation domain-containing protein
MRKTREQFLGNRGFTLVELMVAVFLTAIAVISIYRGYTSFSQSADTQQQVMEMQQNLRIGMSRLAADIRRAGMNEEYLNVAGFVCDDPDVAVGEQVPVLYTSIQFTMDLGSDFVAPDTNLFATDGVDNDEDGVADNDPDPDIAAKEAAEEFIIGDGDVTDDGEKIKYFLQANGTTNDLIRGVWDNASGSYNTQTIITNVEWLDFVYRNEDGDLLPTTPLVVCPAGSGLNSLDLGDLDDIHTVEITLVVRTTNEDYRYTNTDTYSNLDASRSFDPPDDNFRRRAFTMVVQIRNHI